MSPSRPVLIDGEIVDILQQRAQEEDRSATYVLNRMLREFLGLPARAQFVVRGRPRKGNA